MKTKFFKQTVILIVSLALVFIYNHYFNSNIVYHEDHRDDIEQIVPKSARKIKEYVNEPGGINAVYIDERENNNVIYLSYVYGMVTSSPTVKDIDINKNKVTIEVLEHSNNGAGLMVITSHIIEIPVNKEINKIEIKEVNKGPYYLSKVFTGMIAILILLLVFVSRKRLLHIVRRNKKT